MRHRPGCQGAKNTPHVDSTHTHTHTLIRQRCRRKMPIKSSWLEADITIYLKKTYFIYNWTFSLWMFLLTITHAPPVEHTHTQTHTHTHTHKLTYRANPLGINFLIQRVCIYKAWLVCQSPAVHHTLPCCASKQHWCPPFAVSHISNACCYHLALSRLNPGRLAV